MRCLFCKSDTVNARSVEHIIPESLGNKRHVLPRGVVCDQCNNYFSRKVEGPLLSHVSFRNLRAWYRVPNKRGIEPSLYGFVAGTDIDIGLRVQPNVGLEIRSEQARNQHRLREQLRAADVGAEANVFVFPMGIAPPKHEMSRFMAKIALEAISLRFSHDPTLLDLLIDDLHYDRIRRWARRGEGVVQWPYYHRRIFPEETLMVHPETDEWVQAGFGYDLFLTKRRETYFAFCIYGDEFVINVGGPSIKGYEEWLRDHGNISPLVERIGLHLERRLESGEEKFYLFGDQNLVVGRDFDRNQMDKSWVRQR